MALPTARAPLNRSRVLRAALDLIDDAGLEALSMRKLGAALGVEAMSLYNHVASKEDLLGGVADLLLEMVELPERSDDLRADIHRLCQAVRAVGVAHPHAFPLLVTQPRASLDAWAPVLAGFELVQMAGLTEEQAVTAVNVVSSYMVGFVLFEINDLAHTPGPNTQFIRESDIPHDRPQLRRYIAARPNQNHDEAFAQGLDVLLAGIMAGAIRP